MSPRLRLPAGVRSRVRAELARRPALRLRVWDLRRRLRLGDDPRLVAAQDSPRHRRTLALPQPPDGREPRRRELAFEAPERMYVLNTLLEKGFGGYEVESLACFLAMTDAAPAGHVLDIGANIGVYGLLAGSVTEREVVAFEPTPWIAREAAAAARLNGLPVRVRGEALGAERTVATFYLSDRTDSSSSLAAGFRPSSHQIDVRVERLDDLVAAHGWRPAVVKIDTETTEPHVVRGAARTLDELRPWVLCEVLHGRSEADLQAAFAPHGYTMYHVRDEVPFEPATTIAGDPTYANLMWLFLPEPAPDGFWDLVRGWRSALEQVRA
jgi:FkbM family methyltransferase